MKKKLYTVLILFFSSFLLFLPTTSKAETVDSSLQSVKDSGKLVMGVSPDYPPYEFLVKKDGKEKVTGMDVKIAEKIAKDIGVKLEIKTMDFDSLLVALETKKVDMVISGMSPTPERRESVDFSDVYLKAGQKILVRESDKGIYQLGKDLKGKKIGAQTGSMQYDLVKNQMKEAELKGLPKTTDLILALQSNKVDGVLMEEASAVAYEKNTKDIISIESDLKLTEGQNSMAIAFKKGSGSLVNAANKSIATIKKDKLIPTYLEEAGKDLTANTSNTSMWHYWRYFAKGIGYTLLITIVSVLIGTILGSLLAWVRIAKVKILSPLATAYVEFVRGTPLMIQLMFVYFGVGILFNVPALLAGIIAVSLNSSAYVAEIVRGGINAVMKGQNEAARSLGMSGKQTMRFIIFPQAIKNIWPALGNEFISVIKESSIVSIIGVTDLIYQLKVVQTATYKGVAPIAIAMVLYFIMTFTLSKILKHYEGKMQHD